MSHIGAILAAVDSPKIKEAMARQYQEPMPVLFSGYLPSACVDVGFELEGHAPKYADLRGEYYAKAKEPVNARIFNVHSFMQSSDSNMIQPLATQVSRSLRKLGCTFGMSNETVSNKEGKPEYKSFIGFPNIRPVGDVMKPVFVREHDSAARGAAYFMTVRAKDANGQERPLATPKQVAEAFGYTVLMDALGAEHEALLKEKMGLELRPALREAFAQDGETGSRLMTYMLAHKRIEPGEVEREFGHDMLLKACSRENVAWVRGLRGLPEGSLAEELPLADKYLKTRNAMRPAQQQHNGKPTCASSAVTF